MSRPGPVLCLLLALTAALGCKGEDATPAAPGKAPKGLAPLGAQAPTGPAQDKIEALKARLAAEPDDALLLGGLADAYFEARRYPEAIPLYERALTLAPGDADVLNDLGLSKFYVGDNDAALTSVTAATEADPSFKHAWLSKGFILLSMGRLDEAVAPLHKVKELDPAGPLSKTADGFLETIEAARKASPEAPPG